MSDLYKHDLYAKELYKKPIKEITDMIRKALSEIEYYKSELPKREKLLRACLKKTKEPYVIYNCCFSYENAYNNIIQANIMIESGKNAIKIKKDLKSRSVDK